jgi:hypothetical protein
MHASIAMHTNSAISCVPPDVRRRALYPAAKKLSTGDWRTYWLRVQHSFACFFSDKGLLRWSQIAAEDAKVDAVRAGKSASEQDADAARAMRMVSSEDGIVWPLFAGCRTRTHTACARPGVCLRRA